MRYYILCSGVRSAKPYVIAEVVRDSTEVGDDRETSLAATLAGARSIIVTRTELMDDPDGRQALEAWERRDDTDFEMDTVALSDEGSTPSRGNLRLVAEDETETDRFGRLLLPDDLARRELIYYSRGLRAATRELVQRARAQRIERAVARTHRIDIKKVVRHD